VSRHYEAEEKPGRIGHINSSVLSLKRVVGKISEAALSFFQVPNWPTYLTGCALSVLGAFSEEGKISGQGLRLIKCRRTSHLGINLELSRLP